MKTAGRENPDRWAKLSSNRALGAGDQNRSCSIMWAAKQENFQPAERCFFLTSPFIELIRRSQGIKTSIQRKSLCEIARLQVGRSVEGWPNQDDFMVMHCTSAIVLEGFPRSFITTKYGAFPESCFPSTVSMTIGLV